MQKFILAMPQKAIAESEDKKMIINDKQGKEYFIPMEVTNETIHDFGIDPEQVVFTKIGNRRVKAIMIPVDSKKLYDEFMRPLWVESKQEERSRRCSVSNGKGKLKRCTDDCSKCERLHEGSILSIDELSEVGFEKEYPENDTAEIVVEMIFLEELIKILDELDPESRRICELIKEGLSDRRIASELNMAKSTFSDRKRKLLAKLHKYLDVLR